jgi:hypothetical protein
MPTTIVIDDPRPRTRSILLDLSDPYRYRIEVQRETVNEVSGQATVYRRRPTRTITREVLFDKVTDAPSGDADVLALLPQIRALVEKWEAEDVAAEGAAPEGR